MSLATTEVTWFFYYFTYWGFMANLISLFSSMRAASCPKQWQQVAVVSTQISLSMNLILTLLFWGMMAPKVFNDLKWDGIDFYLRFQLFTLHTLPLFTTVVNVLFTDITFLKKDWKIIMLVGSSYSVANCIGCLALGHALYPVVDWQIPSVSIIIFTFIAAIMSSVHLLASYLTQRHKSYCRKHHSKEHNMPVKTNTTCI
jgi:hypothetical protein